MSVWLQDSKGTKGCPVRSDSYSPSTESSSSEAAAVARWRPVLPAVKRMVCVLRAHACVCLCWYWNQCVYQTT